MNRDRAKSTALLQKIASYRAASRSSSKDGKRCIRAIIVTVDAPTPGKREADEKTKSEVVLVST